MTTQIKVTKLNMTQIFNEDGRVVPVTIVKTDEGIEDDFVGKDVIIVGKSKGKGFTGVMKKWGFKGARASHGQSDKPRAPGSIGSQTPGRVYKGKKMAGRQGNKRVTVKGLKIVKVDKTNKNLFVSGPIPGARNARVVIKFA